MEKQTKKQTQLSPAKLLANFMNAQLSTGPITEAGKAKSKMNALRHGLTGQFYVMNEPDRFAYTAFEEEMFDAWAPVGAREKQLAITLTQNHWRLNRARALECNLYGVGHENYVQATNAETAEVEAAITQAQTWSGHYLSITNLTLYETRIENMIARTEKRLESLQETRKAMEEKAMEEAELLFNLAVMKAEPVLPVEVGGFVFSASTLQASLTRRTTLAEARFYKANHWNASKTFRAAAFGPLMTPNPLPEAA